MYGIKLLAVQTSDLYAEHGIVEKRRKKNRQKKLMFNRSI